MANLAIQSLAYFFILLGGFLMVVAVILPFWKEPDYEGVVDRTNGMTVGIFWRCSFKGVGHWDCTNKNKWFFARESWWVACCTMSIISCCLWSISIFTTLPGMSCTVFFRDDKEKRYKIMLANCVSFFLSGFMNLLASAIYAKEVMIEWQENREKGNSDNYQWGRCIYIACVSGWILVIASVILFYSSRYQKLEEGKSDFSF